MDPKEIFELIIKADEKLKYATDANRELARARRATLLEQARDAAREIGNEALVSRPRRAGGSCLSRAQPRNAPAACRAARR